MPDAACTATETDVPGGARTAAIPSSTDAKLDQVTFYTRTLAVPARRDVGSKATTPRPGSCSTSIGCTACHTRRADDRPVATSPPLDQQTIRPYTDLLLHDMGRPGRRPARRRRLRHASGAPRRCGASAWSRPSTATPASSTTAAPAASRRPSCGTAARPKAQVRFTDLDRADRSAILDFLESL